MSSCLTCARTRTKLAHFEADLHRAARRAARTDTPRTRAAVAAAKTDLERARLRLAEPHEPCTA